MTTSHAVPHLATHLVPLSTDQVARWRSWADGPRGRRTLTHWAVDHRLAGWSTDDLAAPTGSIRTDRMQAALVDLAQRGDADAALTLVVQLRPGLISIARSLTEPGLDHHSGFRDRCEDVQAEFFVTLFRHRLDRRPTMIAANLLLDTRQRLRRATVRRRRIEAVVGRQADQAFRPDPGATGSDRADRSPTDSVDEQLDLIRSLRRTIDHLPGSPRSKSLTADLAYRSWILDQPNLSIADELGIDRRVVVTRLHRLRNRLREDLEDRTPVSAVPSGDANRSAG